MLSPSRDPIYNAHRPNIPYHARATATQKDSARQQRSMYFLDPNSNPVNRVALLNVKMLSQPTSKRDHL